MSWDLWTLLVITAAAAIFVIRSTMADIRDTREPMPPSCYPHMKIRSQSARIVRPHNAERPGRHSLEAATAREFASMSGQVS